MKRFKEYLKFAVTVICLIYEYTVLTAVAILMLLYLIFGGSIIIKINWHSWEDFVNSWNK